MIEKVLWAIGLMAILAIFFVSGFEFVKAVALYATIFAIIFMLAWTMFQGGHK